MKLSHIKLLLLSALFLLAFTANASDAGDRWKLKRMCWKQYKACKKEKSRVTCWRSYKQCRKDNKVTAKDDLIFVRDKLKSFVKKVVGHISFELDQDEEYGEFVKTTVSSKHFKKMNTFMYSPEHLKSYIELVQREGSEEKDIIIKMYTVDIEEFANGQDLQTSPGRSFPKFSDGRVFDTLFGLEFPAGALGNMQIYVDPEEKIFGFFVPSSAAGQVINWINETKNKIKFIKDIIPNIKYIPFNIKAHKKKFGRFSILAETEAPNSSGIVVLFDHAKIVELLRDLQAEEKSRGGKAKISITKFKKFRIKQINR